MRIIAGRWGGRPIQAPVGRGTRPTPDRVREAWMSALMPRLPGARVLDLFAGSGALGLETLSRGAAHVTFVEKARGALRSLRDNLERLDADPEDYEVVQGDAMSYVRRLAAGDFDVALADPPYRKGLAEALLGIFVDTPFAAELWVEHAADERFETPPGARTRRYGDTAITSLTHESNDE